MNKGYNLILLEPQKTKEIVDEINSNIKGQGLIEILEGNIDYLSKFNEKNFDFIIAVDIITGLTELEKQIEFLNNIYRILKRNGIFITTLRTLYSPIRALGITKPDEISKDIIGLANFLSSGKFKSKTEPDKEYVFFHPSFIKSIFETNRFKTLKVFSLESLFPFSSQKIEMLEDKNWKIWFELNYQLASDPSIWGLSENMLYIGKK